MWYLFIIYALTEHCCYNRFVFIIETCFLTFHHQVVVQVLRISPHA
jgi:hypothetical protein